jgi:hypothetical protein
MNKLYLILLVIISCNVCSQDLTQDVYSIIKAELNRNLSLYQNKKVYLKFSLDDYIIGYLTELKKDKLKRSVIKSKIDNNIFETLFNEDKINEMIYQNNKIKLDSSKLNLNDVIIDNTESEDKTINNLQGLSKIKIFLSKPFFNENKDYALIAFSNGYEDSMQGGINLYKKTHDKWVFYESIDYWFE